MDTRERRTHWDHVYEARAPEEVSWFQPSPDRSLALIEHAGVGKDAAILDVGGGASRLAGALLERGFCDVTVLDISERALAEARGQLGPRSDEVRWITADVTEVSLERRYALWHDRAVFHFLVDEDDRRRYRELLSGSTSPGAQVIVATFALDGPERCSGLPIVRYSPESLLAALGPGLTLIESEAEEHHTPAGTVQRFVYCRFRRDDR
jgi:SAM-dependent methyltransferase